jgi:hypothetical protein
MQLEWSAEMEKALAGAGSAPARVQIPGSDCLHVLLPRADFDWVRETVTEMPDAPLVLNPAQQFFAVVPLRDYERFMPFFEEDPVSREEQLAALRAAGLRAGWNDPVWEESLAK